LLGKRDFGDAVDEGISVLGLVGGGDVCGGCGTRGGVVFTFFFCHVSVVIHRSL